MKKRLYLQNSVVDLQIGKNSEKLILNLKHPFSEGVDVTIALNEGGIVLLISVLKNDSQQVQVPAKTDFCKTIVRFPTTKEDKKQLLQTIDKLTGGKYADEISKTKKK